MIGTTDLGRREGNQAHGLKHDGVDLAMRRQYQRVNACSKVYLQWLS